MPLRLPNVSLQMTLLLGNLAASLPPIAVATFGADWSLCLFAAMVAGLLSALAARLLARPMLAAIRSITTQTPDGVVRTGEAAGRATGFVPCEIRALIAEVELARRPASARRRRATDARTLARDGTTGAPLPPRPAARPHDPALIDPVTGLANRRGLAEHLANVDGESPLEGTIAVHCLALTDLESVTGALGREASEAVLRGVARRIADSVRESDLVARIAPAGIAIVQHDVRSRENALSLAQRIRSLMAEPLRIGDWEIAAAVSIGIALAPEGAEAHTAWLIEAETALQQARTCGAGAIMIFEEKMRGAVASSARGTLARV